MRSCLQGQVVTEQRKMASNLRVGLDLAIRKRLFTVRMLRHCCPEMLWILHPAVFQSQTGRDFEQCGIVENVPAHDREVESRWYSKSLPTQPYFMILWLLKKNCCLYFLFVCGSHLLHGQMIGVALWFSPECSYWFWSSIGKKRWICHSIIEIGTVRRTKLCNKCVLRCYAEGRCHYSISVTAVQ